MVSLNRCIVTATTDGTEKLALRLGVSHELVVVTPNGQIFETLHAWMMSSNFIVVIVKVLNDRILMVRVRITK